MECASLFLTCFCLCSCNRFLGGANAACKARLLPPCPRCMHIQIRAFVSCQVLYTCIVPLKTLHTLPVDLAIGNGLVGYQSKGTHTWLTFRVLSTLIFSLSLSFKSVCVSNSRWMYMYQSKVVYSHTGTCTCICNVSNDGVYMQLLVVVSVLLYPYNDSMRTVHLINSLSMPT